MRPHLHLLVLRGDGTRALRCRVPRWFAAGALGSFAAAAAAGGVVGGHYVRMRLDAGDVAALRRDVAAQRVLLETFRARVATVRAEVDAWTALHAKMRKAFGRREAPDTAARIAAGGRPAQELASLATTVAEETPRVRELERDVRRTVKLVSALPLRWPVRGRLNSGFGIRRSPWSGQPERHDGIDIGIAPGTVVRAPAPGTVIAAAAGGGYGRHVRIDHGNGVVSVYAHLARTEVRVGERVARGQVIGRVGSTGRSTGPHLHYEVRVAGKPVDPRGFLQEP
jgi:murein DD-endopeptidase MepM/ murein hydrolase activator NlpD